MKTFFFVILTLAALSSYQSSHAQLSRKVRFEEGHVTFTIPFGFELDSKTKAATQSDFPSHEGTVARSVALHIPGIPAIARSVSVRRFSSPSGSTLFVEAFRGRALTADEVNEFFPLLNAANTYRLSARSIEGNRISLVFLYQPDFGVFQSRHEIIFSSEGFILFSFFDEFWGTSKERGFDDVHKLWYKNEEGIIRSVKFDDGFSNEMALSDRQKSLNQPSKYLESKIKRYRILHPELDKYSDDEIIEATRTVESPQAEAQDWRNAFMKVYGNLEEESKHSSTPAPQPAEQTHQLTSTEASSTGNRFVYYGARAIPSAILFTVAVVPFYFGLRRFRATKVLFPKHFVFALCGYWLLASAFGILGGEASAPIPTRVALVILGTGIVFWGVSMLFRRKQGKTTT